MRVQFDIIYCPFYEADISAWSEMIERLGTFPLFVLTSLSNSKNTIEKIIKATKLNPSAVMETVDELIENKLLKKESDNFFLLPY